MPRLFTLVHVTLSVVLALMLGFLGGILLVREQMKPWIERLSQPVIVESFTGDAAAVVKPQGFTAQQLGEWYAKAYEAGVADSRKVYEPQLAAATKPQAASSVNLQPVTGGIDSLRLLIQQQGTEITSLRQVATRLSLEDKWNYELVCTIDGVVQPKMSPLGEVFETDASLRAKLDAATTSVCTLKFPDFQQDVLYSTARGKVRVNEREAGSGTNIYESGVSTLSISFTKGEQNGFQIRRLRQTKGR